MNRAGDRPKPDSTDTIAQIEILQMVPARPHLLARPSHWPMALRSVADYLTQAPWWLARLRGLIDIYPKPFRRLRFASADGTQLTGWLGCQMAEGRRGRRRRLDRREGLLVVPGMFSTKDNWIQKARALAVFRDWGYHVFAIDLRGFGESRRVYSTPGWKEAEDVVAAVKIFRENAPLHKLHIYSESLGASAALIAAGMEGRKGRRLIDGGLLAVSPFSDAQREVEHISSKPVVTSQFYMVQWFFRRLLQLGGHHYDTFTDYMRDAARAYEVDLPLLYERSSPRHFLADINVPALILHADDDPVVPVEHGRDFEALLEGRRNPAIWRLPWGSHCLWELLDPDWFWTVLKQFFDFHCVIPRHD